MVIQYPISNNSNKMINSDLTPYIEQPKRLNVMKIIVVSYKYSVKLQPSDDVSTTLLDWFISAFLCKRKIYFNVHCVEYSCSALNLLTWKTLQSINIIWANEFHFQHREQTIHNMMKNIRFKTFADVVCHKSGDQMVLITSMYATIDKTTIDSYMK